MTPNKAARVRNIVAEAFRDNFLDLPDGSCSIGLVDTDKKPTNLYAYPPSRKNGVDFKQINVDWDGCDVEIAYEYHWANDKEDDWYSIWTARFVTSEEVDGHILYKFSENILPYISGYAEMALIDKIIDKEHALFIDHRADRQGDEIDRVYDEGREIAMAQAEDAHEEELEIKRSHINLEEGEI